MMKEWWLSLVSFGGANDWNPPYADGFGTYYTLRSGPNVLFPTAPFGVCLSDVLSPEQAAREIQVSLGGKTYTVAGRDGHRDMCWIVVTEEPNDSLEQVSLVQDDNLSERFVGFAREDTLTVTAPETGVFVWFHDRFY
jgi:hypothetical protein